MADIIPMRRPVETGFVGPHQYKEYEGWRPPGHLLSPPEYPPGPENEPLELPEESRLFDPEIRPFMDPKLIATIERGREQEKELEMLTAQTDARLEALPEEQKPAARKWLAESRARTAPIAKPTTREEASQLAIRKIGFDPDLMDPNKIIQQQFQQGLPKVIQSVFKKAPGQLTPQENEYLQKAIIPMFQKQVTDSVISKVRAGQGYYKRMMDEFEKGQQAEVKVEDKAEADRRYRVEQERKDREEKRKIEKEARDITKAEEEEDKLEWVVNRKEGLKRQVTPEKADQLIKTGDWKRGRPITEEDRKPSPVTWTTATKAVERRFGSQDPMGNIIITTEVAGMHRVAQKKLVELKRQGIEPLDAVNQAEEHARTIEKRYWEFMDSYKDNKETIEKIQTDFRRR